MHIKKGLRGLTGAFGLGIFILSIVLSGSGLQIVQAQTMPVVPISAAINVSNLSIANNAWGVIEPIMTKANANPALITSSAETTGTAAINVTFQEDGMSDFITLSASALSQEIYNTNTDTVAKSQSTANFNVVAGPQFAKLAGMSEANVGVELRTFINAGNQREFYFRINNMTPKLYQMLVKSVGTSKNKVQLNTWYKMNGALKKIMVPTVATTRAESVRRETEAVKLLFSNMTLAQDFGMDTTTLVPSRHLKLGFTREGLMNIVNGSVAITGNPALTPSELKEIKEALDEPELQKIIDGTKLDLWVGPEDGRMYRIQLAATNINFPMGSSNSSLTLSYDLSARAKSINSLLKIDKPAKFIDLQKIIDESKAEAQKKAKEAMAKAYLSNQRAEAELYYAQSATGSYVGYCQSNKSPDSFIVMKQKLAQSGFIAECAARAQDFVITAKLAPNRYWCVDAKGTSLELKTNRRAAGYFSCK